MKNQVDPFGFACRNQGIVSRQLDEILVVEIATTCWLGSPPAGERKEIIQIAVCPLNIQTGKMSDGRGILVRPRRSSISNYCEQRTGLAANEVHSGLTLREACTMLAREFGSGDRVWASYGNTTRRRFKHECSDQGVRYPFSSSHINIKVLTALMRALPREISLTESMRIFNQTGSTGRGPTMDAAVNAALLLARLLMESRVKYVVGVN